MEKLKNFYIEKFSENREGLNRGLFRFIYNRTYI